MSAGRWGGPTRPLEERIEGLRALIARAQRDPFYPLASLGRAEAELIVLDAALEEKERAVQAARQLNLC